MSRLFIISAPSGAGKTTLVNRIIERINPPYTIERAITFTSKTARVTEKQGYDYHFVTPEEFEKRIQDGFFLEYSCTYGTYYGTPRTILEGLARGIAYFLILDRVGAEQIRGKIPEAVLIWIQTSSFDELRKRLHNRGTETEEQINKRLVVAQQEIEKEKKEPIYQYQIINDEFNVAISMLMDIVIPTLEKCMEKS